MNREIKFKLWCTNKNEWEKNNFVILPNGSLLDVDKRIPMSKETHILLQYTGLKDKNGKELYSNDLFKSYQTGDFIFRCWEVKGGFAINYGFDKWKDDIKSDEPLPLLPLADQQTISWFESTCEIIGNIYDNKELIENL